MAYTAHHYLVLPGTWYGLPWLTSAYHGSLWLTMAYFGLPWQGRPELLLLLRPMAPLPPNHPTRRNLNLAAAPGFVKLGAKPSPRRARGGGGGGGSGGGGGGGVKGWFARGRQGGVLSYLGLQGDAILARAVLTMAIRGAALAIAVLSMAILTVTLLVLTLAILTKAMRPCPRRSCGAGATLPSCRGWRPWSGSGCLI